MENVLLYIFVNFNLTIVFRMLQGVSPLKIRLDRIRNYDMVRIIVVVDFN